MADALRGSMDAGEYKHVVLGLIFLESQEGGEFYTPRCVVKLLVEILSVEFICAHAKGNANFAWVHEA